VIAQLTMPGGEDTSLKVQSKAGEKSSFGKENSGTEKKISEDFSALLGEKLGKLKTAPALALLGEKDLSNDQDLSSQKLKTKSLQNLTKDSDLKKALSLLLKKQGSEENEEQLAEVLGKQKPVDGARELLDSLAYLGLSAGKDQIPGQERKNLLELMPEKNREPVSKNTLGPSSLKVVIEDRRTGTVASKNERESGLEGTGALEPGNSSSRNPKLVERGGENKGDSVLHIEAGRGGMITAEGDGGKIQAPVSRQVLENLSQEIRNHGAQDIVRQAKVILKDNQMGEIRLQIKPESLGEVRISLSLDNGRLGGNILVENSNVRDIFLNNMDSLVRGFRNEGFQTSGLDVNVRGESFSQNQNQSSDGTGAWFYDSQQPGFDEDREGASLLGWYGIQQVDFKA